jgi:hypothetical protein
MDIRPKITHHSSIDIGLSFISKDLHQAIASSLSNKQLKILELQNNGYDDISDIIKHLRNMKSLHTVNLDFYVYPTPFAKETREEIADFIATNTTIQNFSLRGWLLVESNYLNAFIFT